jgi:hypothetical protein
MEGFTPKTFDLWLWEGSIISVPILSCVLQVQLAYAATPPKFPV